MNRLKTPKNVPEFVVIQHYLKGHNGILWERHIKFFCGLAVLEKNSYWHKKLINSTKWKVYPLIYLYKAKKLKPKDILAHFGTKIYAAYKIEYKKEADRLKKEREQKTLNSLKLVDKSTIDIKEKDEELEKRLKDGLCSAKTKKGVPCKGKHLKDSKYCVFHKKKR